jgi:hypothetical protein
MAMPAYLPAIGSAAYRKLFEMQPEINFFPPVFTVELIGRNGSVHRRLILVMVG